MPGKAQERIPEVPHRGGTDTLTGIVVRLKHMLGMAAARYKGAMIPIWTCNQIVMDTLQMAISCLGVLGMDVA